MVIGVEAESEHDRSRSDASQLVVLAWRRFCNLQKGVGNWGTSRSGRGW
jgi:hypothetical protein